MSRSITNPQRERFTCPTIEQAQECLDHGLVLALFGQRAEAMRFYRKALLIDPDNTLGHYMLGLSLMKQGQTDGAIVEWYAAALTTRGGSQANWARRQAGRLLKVYGERSQ